MGYSTALLACLVAAVAAGPTRGPERIAGGFPAFIVSFPFMAPLLYSTDLINFSQACAGSIINTRSILTAGNCLYGTTELRWRIRVGSTYASKDGTVHSASHIITHPGYEPQKLDNDNDIAIIRSATSIIFVTGSVQPATIALPDFEVPDGDVLRAVGWGYQGPAGLKSDQIMYVDMWAISRDTCKERYMGLVSDNMICAGYLDVGGRGQCAGDNGGPLLHNNIVVGVFSGSSTECNSGYYPSINTRVSNYYPWILSNA